MGVGRKTADPSSTLAAEGAVDFYGTLLLGDGQPPSTMGSVCVCVYHGTGRRQETCKTSHEPAGPSVLGRGENCPQDSNQVRP